MGSIIYVPGHTQVSALGLVYIDVCPHMSMQLKATTFYELCVQRGDGGIEVRATHTPQGLLERHPAQTRLIQSLDTLVVVTLEK